MRATLPHLRLLTLPSADRISLLAKFLTSHEMTYLSMKLLFPTANSSEPVPLSLNPNTNSRIEGDPFKPHTFELIPESAITDGLLNMKIF